MAHRMRTGDRVTLDGMPGLWRIQRIERQTIWLTGIDEFAKTFCKLSTCGTVGVRRKEVAAAPFIGETLI